MMTLTLEKGEGRSLFLYRTLTCNLPLLFDAVMLTFQILELIVATITGKEVVYKILNPMLLMCFASFSIV
jgi:hypothetical protein